ncbi:MAG TPA: DUF4190 domain-containing protein [Acidimicrobiales bacterium]|nr:DUF4190 domain-containing protein [Acidimicrobiales bacterium]
MSDAPQGPGWWQASDGKWYPPTAQPGTPRPPAAPGPSPYGPGPAPYGPGAAPYGPGPAPYGPGPAPYGYGYAPNPNGTPSGLPSVNGFATASLVLGIFSLVICCAPFMLCSLAGLPLGIYALTRINKRTADPGPRGLAITGVVVNGIGFAILAIVAVAAVAGS